MILLLPIVLWFLLWFCINFIDCLVIGITDITQCFLRVSILMYSISYSGHLFTSFLKIHSFISSNLLPFVSISKEERGPRSIHVRNGPNKNLHLIRNVMYQKCLKLRKTMLRREGGLGVKK